MAKLDINTNDFGNFVISYLLDKLLNPDEISPDNDLFNDFIKLLEDRSFKAHLLKWYMKQDSFERFSYKRLRPVFTGEQKRGIINLSSVKQKKTKKLTKKAAIKLVKTLVKLTKTTGGT